jgi:hypothetical protein
VSRRWVLFPARFVARAVVAGVRLSSSVPSSSPVVAAVGLAVARSQRLAALAPHIMHPFNAEVSDGGGQQSPKSANGYRPALFAQAKLGGAGIFL